MDQIEAAMNHLFNILQLCHVTLQAEEYYYGLFPALAE